MADAAVPSSRRHQRRARNASATALGIVAVIGVLASEPKLARRVSYAQLVGERRWNIYLDGRIEVRLPEREPEKAWRRLAAQHQENGLLGRAIKAVDLRHSAWLTLELADELYTSAKGSST